jgi:hypothetical protein
MMRDGETKRDTTMDVSNIQTDSAVKPCPSMTTLVPPETGPTTGWLVAISRDRRKEKLSSSSVVRSVMRREREDAIASSAGNDGVVHSTDCDDTKSAATDAIVPSG